MNFKNSLYLIVLIILIGTKSAFAQSIEDEALDWLQAYIQVDTMNPPGNETRAVEFIARILEAEGIPYKTAESAPGRGNLWARLEGGDEAALILLQHTDVVPADPDYWSTDPLSGEIRDGFLWGRGTLDMKGTGISQLATFVSLHRAGVPLNRDVILVASADEEAGGFYGAGWLVEHHPEIFAGAGLLINEGGYGKQSAKELIFNVEVTQKVPVWLRLTAVDTPGHGSMPNATSSVTRIVDALGILRANPFPPRIVPAVDAMFQSLSLSASAAWEEAYSNMAPAVKERVVGADTCWGSYYDVHPWVVATDVRRTFHHLRSKLFMPESSSPLKALWCRAYRMGVAQGRVAPPGLPTPDRKFTL
jgi:hypothetical protein